MSNRLPSIASSRVGRRFVLRGGLAGLATLMGCGADEQDDPSGAGGSGTGGSAGAGAGGTSGSGGAGGSTMDSGPPLVSNIANLGDLGDPDANGVRLPDGFTARIIAITGDEPVAGSGYPWHPAPDGGATFATPDGGWIYVSNSEAVSGGAGALRFDASGELVGAYSILSGSFINCAGGLTPWGTWLSCEEVPRGRVFECDPFGEEAAVERPALGIFKHEAAAVDPDTNHVYLTEDDSEGRFYRFIPAGMDGDRPDLGSGRLEVAEEASDGSVTWHEVPDPTYSGSEPTQTQVPTSTAYPGGEGIWYHQGVIYFSNKGEDRVRAYDIATAKITVIYDADTAANPILTGVDNLTVTCCGDILVAEDGGDMQIVAILPDGSLKPIVQIMGHDISEVTGPAFDPSGTRLYFSSQRGSDGRGVTYEVTGPFHL